MRLDKYLHLVRVVRHRPDVRELCEADLIRLNGRPVKASHEVGRGDLVGVTFRSRKLVVRVVEVPSGGSVPRREVSRYLDVVSDERTGEDDG